MNEQNKQHLNRRKQIKPKRKNVAARALAQQRSVRIKIDSDKLFFRRRNLSIHDFRYLMNKGYKEAKFMGVNKKKEKYLIKPRENEGDEHFFLTFTLANYLKSISKKIELFETLKPDIIFELNGQSYAIEIETGSLYLKAREQLARKVEELKNNFEDRYCFVVTNENFAPIYNRFGKTFTRTTFLKQFSKWLKKH